MIEHVGSDGDRKLLMACVDDLGAWPATLDGSERHFVLFVALDARGVDDEAILGFARKLVAGGAVYVCAWGPDCERVHDRFDDALDEHVPEWREAPVMTTWHADDTLDEALWFALFAACPDDVYLSTCEAVLAVVVARDDWAEQVRGRLGAADRFKTDAAL